MTSSSVKEWPDWERRGTMVTPEWPPMTVILASSVETFLTSETKREARTTSRVVTPKSLSFQVPSCIERTAIRVNFHGSIFPLLVFGCWK